MSLRKSDEPSVFRHLAMANVLPTRRTVLTVMSAAGLLLATDVLSGCSSDSPNPSQTGQSAGPAKNGGTLTVGATGGVPSNTLDPNSGALGDPQVARLTLLYNALVVLDVNAQTRFDLAESITPNSDATEWTIKLRKGITFHDGKPLTADDVIFTLKRVTDPAKPLNAAKSLGPMDVANISKVDDLTVKVPYKSPYATLIEQMATYYYFLFIAPTGFDIKKPVGTGPYMYQSFTPARESTFIKNPNYWKSGLPHFDTSGCPRLCWTTPRRPTRWPLSRLMPSRTSPRRPNRRYQATPTSRSSTSKSGAMVPFTMRVDQPPFNDVRVRQAMRLIVDRPQLISNALGGEASLGSDVFSPFDPCFDQSLQRQQDIPQAKALLKAAGQEGLQVTLTSTQIHQFSAMAQVFAQNAQAAGVTVKIDNLDNATYYGPQYHKWNFAFQYWLYNPYLPQVAQATLPGVPGSSTHFDNPEYNALYTKANATVDAKERCSVSNQMMKIDFNEGGYIIPAFLNVNDAYQSAILGIEPSKIGLSLGNFGFESMSFA